MFLLSSSLLGSGPSPRALTSMFLHALKAEAYAPLTPLTPPPPPPPLEKRSACAFSSVDDGAWAALPIGKPKLRQVKWLPNSVVLSNAVLRTACGQFSPSWPPWLSQNRKWL